uniref:HMA domain-containing protein n=1 Tax=Tetraselmis sp. GSL018 TaxID=582737 RepID=A0A061QZA8_9CHLO|mmetsp:Transcript_11103/g.26342  ORF Transcript_11103/g.26342 Transcript_11103/m.26342 type:complete len:156 (-) Transcript_11103:82-549(-)|eukprot:CAMPEP_0177610326 /NCGR_PEP_ID=MMETSP0419_2-20121207/19701_1 /TAXON_ID=582737 /ORGANISM="Tetraselmis sp., Strain GSL018" /LENGTH=155 /DNA_ID=CAMNT_0019105587 /DNA_START=51 /DNA_END=518 /DNA_ORIENTATION=+
MASFLLSVRQVNGQALSPPTGATFKDFRYRKPALERVRQNVNWDFKLSRSALSPSPVQYSRTKIDRTCRLFSNRVSLASSSGPVIVLKVEGMMCNGCTSSVETALNQIAGVRAVTVSLDEAKATVEIEDTRDPENMLQTLISAVKECGFEASASK